MFTEGTLKHKKPCVFRNVCFIFPQLIAGPIVRYTDIAKMLDERRENISQFADGIKVVCCGFGKESSYRKSNGCTLGYNQRNIVKRHSRCVDWHNFIRVSDIFLTFRDIPIWLADWVKCSVLNL